MNASSNRGAVVSLDGESKLNAERPSVMTWNQNERVMPSLFNYIKSRPRNVCVIP
jgi:hypothetical protein